MKMKLVSLQICLLSILSLSAARADQANNLEFPEGTALNTSGDFGHIEKSGNGPVKMILIADVGFGWDIYKGFMKKNKKRFTMYAVTLPGSGGSPPLPMPAQNTSYGKRTGLETLQTALLNLIENEKIVRPVVAGNLLIASWLALNTAINYPEKISGVIIFSGMPYASWPSPKDPTGKTPVSMVERVPNIDYYTMPRIFKPMSRETWLKNLFQPYQYTNDSALGSGLYWETTTVLIPAMARYLGEFYTTDVSTQFMNIKIPVLVLVPGFNDEYFTSHPASTDKKYFWDEWTNAGTNNYFTIEKIPDARLFVWVDQPDMVDRSIRIFTENKFVYHSKK